MKHRPESEPWTPPRRPRVPPGGEEIVRLRFSPDLDEQAGTALGDYVQEKRDVFQRVTGWRLGAQLGCGYWGCVFGSEEPWVVKVTRDPTEGPMWAFIREMYDEHGPMMAGFLRVDDVLRLRPDVAIDVDLAIGAGEVQPVYAVRREEADPMFGLATRRDRLRMTERTSGELRVPPMLFDEMKVDQHRSTVEFRGALEILSRYKRRAKDIAMELATGDPVPEVLADLEGLAVRAALALADHAMFAALSESLVLMAKSGAYFGDVHPGNIGWRVHEEIGGTRLGRRSVIVTDPGLASTPYTPTVREALLRNRRRLRS